METRLHIGFVFKRKLDSGQPTKSYDHGYILLALPLFLSISSESSDQIFAGAHLIERHYI